MSLTSTELLRIQAIENSLNDLQTAANNLATKRELKNLLAILQRDVLALQTEIEQLELTGSGSALANHKIDPDAHTQLDARYFRENEHISTSSGAPDAGKPIVLSASGVLDSSLLPGGGSSFAGDHGFLGGLTDDDHPLYLTESRADTWALTNQTVTSGLTLAHDRGHEVDSVADHIAASSANFGKIIRANSSTGAIEYTYPRLTKTAESFSIDINPSTGVDDTDPTPITTQAEAISHGPFATMAGATKALPQVICHNVTYQLSDGTHTPATNLAFGDMAHLEFGISDINTFPTGYPRIIIRSANGYKRVTGTVAMQVGSSGTETFTLATNPGLTTNQYAGYHIRVIAGSGIGQVKSVRSHDGINWSIAGRFSPGLTTTSTIEIVEPSAIIDLRSTFGALLNAVHRAESQQLEILHLNEIEILGDASSTLRILDSSVNFQGCKITKCAVTLTRSRATLHTAIFDGVGTVGTFGILLLNGGIIRGESSSSSWIIRRSLKHGIYCAGTNFGSHWTGQLDIFEGSIQENSGHGIVLEGPDVAMKNATRIRGNGNSGYGIRMLRGAVAYLRLSDFSSGGDYLTGNQGDINIDDTPVSYLDLSGETDKFITGRYGSTLDGNSPLAP